VSVCVYFVYSLRKEKEKHLLGCTGGNVHDILPPTVERSKLLFPTTTTQQNTKQHNETRKL